MSFLQNIVVNVFCSTYATLHMSFLISLTSIWLCPLAQIKLQKYKNLKQSKTQIKGKN